MAMTLPPPVWLPSPPVLPSFKEFVRQCRGTDESVAGLMDLSEACALNGPSNFNVEPQHRVSLPPKAVQRAYSMEHVGGFGVLVRTEFIQPAPYRNESRVAPYDYFKCDRCGTKDTPEKRQGPNGKRTLCNACGLRWVREQKEAAKKAKILLE